jgi:hypothetical protein
MRIRPLITVLCALAALSAAAPAAAQYGARGASNRATGETYRVEIGGYLWDPTPDIVITSASLPGIAGTPVDFVNDLGIAQTWFKQIKIVLRPATKHKFRFEYTPITYDAQTTLRIPIVFNGQSFSFGLPVTSQVTWKAYRFGYEYDFVYRDRGFAGVLLEAKYTDIQATISSVFTSEFVHAQAPIPAIGFIARGYVVPNISITGEFSGFKLPENVAKGSGGNYFDLDIYGTVNFTDHFGAQVGYRSFDVGYRAPHDQGAMTLKGPYVGAAVRF